MIAATPDLTAALATETFSAVAMPSLMSVDSAAVSPTGPTRFGYDAVDPSQHRKSRASAIKAEDAVLTGARRDKLASTTQDLVRNFELAGWMIRKHLDYVTECDFHSATGDQAFDDAVEEWMVEQSAPEQCDIRAKLALDELFRLLESETVVSGDVLAIRTNADKLQLLESDLVRNPRDTGNELWINGVLLDEFERARAYFVYKRSKTGAGYDPVHRISPDNARLFGHWNRISQTRGVSPLASAVNRVCDLYESFGFALNKAKLTQLMGFMFTSAAIEGLGKQETDSTEPRYKINFDRNGIFVLEGEPGDELKLIESNTPAAEFQAFMSAMIHVTLLVLDLPFSFYDESATNFFGSRAGWLHYSRSCEPKRRRHIRARKWYTDWRIGNAILRGDLKPPRTASISSQAFRWVAKGMPWWNPGQEIIADTNAIAAALDTPQRICLERGRGTFEDNVREIAKALKFAQDNGVPVSWNKTAPPPMFERENVKEGGAKS